MEFLKELLGEELYSKVEAKINEHNSNEANGDNQIKLANLGGGEYVSKGKHDSEIEKLNNLLTGKTTELDKANILIGDLQKGTKGNKDLQDAIDTYKNVTVPDLQKQLLDTKIKAAVKIALLSEKATDIDYLTFKLEEKLKAEGKSLELDDNENIKGWDDLLSGLKVQLPNQFETTVNKKVEPNRLPKSEDGQTMSKEEFNKLGYNSRVKLREENPELYDTLTKG